MRCVHTMANRFASDETNIVAGEDASMIKTKLAK